MAFLSRQALRRLGFADIGADVLVSDKASIHGAPRIALGDRVRIDDFCVLSAGEGGISIGSYVHVACQCTLIGKARIELEDFSNLSGRVAVYSSTDDFSGAGMTNPTVPLEYRRVTDAPVRIGRHVVIGTGTVVLPGVTIGEGAAVGALSLVKKSLEPFTLYAGIPARRIGARSRALLDLEAKLRARSSEA
ncbi:MAG: acyltransferase [Burkholderiales bacterium]|nr:acyltransferase [Burkholderiales bacterium]